MAAYTYNVHPLASKEYKDSILWYDEQQEGLGERFLIEFRNKVELILLNPKIFSSKEIKNYREASMDNFPFVIVYKLYEKKKFVFITSVHHTKRNTKSKYRRKPDF